MSLFGRIEDISIVDVLQMVHLGQRSGTLFVWHDPRRAAIVFESGQITRVWSTDYNRLSEMLKAQGLLSDRDLLSAFRTQSRESEPRKLHELLLALGLVTDPALESAVERHVARLVREVTSWTRGSFEFTQEARLAEPIGSTAALDTIPGTKLSVEYMLLEAARLSDESFMGYAASATTAEPFRRAEPRPRSDSSAGRSAGLRFPLSTEDLASLLPAPPPRPRPESRVPRGARANTPVPGSSGPAQPPLPRAASGRASSVPGAPAARSAPPRPSSVSGATPLPSRPTERPTPSSPEVPTVNALKERSSGQEVSRLMSLYVATYQLHASLDPSEVLRAISEVTVNLLGAEQFALLLRDEFGAALLVELREGLSGRVTPYSGEEYLGGEPLLEEALGDGKLRVNPDPNASLRAVMPLEFQGDIVGALVILKMLPHKLVFDDEDRELLHLVGVHAASALYAARLFSRTDRKLKTLESLLHLLRSDAVRARAQERALSVARPVE